MYICQARLVFFTKIMQDICRTDILIRICSANLWFLQADFFGFCLCKAYAYICILIYVFFFHLSLQQIHEIQVLVSFPGLLDQTCVVFRGTIVGTSRPTIPVPNTKKVPLSYTIHWHLLYNIYIYICIFFIYIYIFQLTAPGNGIWLTIFVPFPKPLCLATIPKNRLGCWYYVRQLQGKKTTDPLEHLYTSHQAEVQEIFSYLDLDGSGRSRMDGLDGKLGNWMALQSSMKLRGVCAGYVKKTQGKHMVFFVKNIPTKPKRTSW